MLIDQFTNACVHSLAAVSWSSGVLGRLKFRRNEEESHDETKSTTLLGAWGQETAGSKRYSLAAPKNKAKLCQKVT